MMAGYALPDATITDSIAADKSVNVLGTTTASAVAVKGKRATLTSRNTANLWLTKDLGHGFRWWAAARMPSAAASPIRATPWCCPAT
jgi:catecholate siderophore receptor